MDANTIKAGVLAAGDERGQLGQGSADRNAKGDVNPGHSMSFFNWRARRHGDMLQTQCLNLVHTRKDDSGSSVDCRPSTRQLRRAAPKV